MLSTLLAHHIRQHGPIRTARVSSAHSSTQYSYWGAVRYQIRLTADGSPTNCALERASSDRRSQRLVERDCDNLCESEDRIRCQTIGRLSESECGCVLLALGYAAEVATHDARRRDTTAPAPDLQDRLKRHLAYKGCVLQGVDFRRIADPTSEYSSRDDVRGRYLCRWSYYGWIVVGYLPTGDERDAAAFAAAKNQEVRRTILRACGPDREQEVAAAGRQEIQRDDFGTLFQEWDGSKSVRVVCPSTGSVYWLPVSRKCTTAHEAVADTFGMAAAEYHPVVEA